MADIKLFNISSSDKIEEYKAGTVTLEKRIADSNRKKYANIFRSDFS